MFVVALRAEMVSGEVKDPAVRLRPLRVDDETVARLAILEQSLVVARALGITDVLVTCDDDNVGSASVIERCGGVLDSIVDPESGGTAVRRYWIH